MYAVRFRVYIGRWWGGGVGAEGDVDRKQHSHAVVLSVDLRGLDDAPLSPHIKRPATKSAQRER